jgi:hypothetical protein
MLHGTRKGVLSWVCSIPVFALAYFTLLTAQGAPTFADGVTNGMVNAPGLSEASGIVASRNNANVLWTHNDSGHPAEVIAIDTQGRWLGTYTLPGNIDNEDIAIGPGPVTNVSYLYIGDIGDNFLVRSSIRVFQIPEPAVYARQYTNPMTVGMKGARTITLTYPDGPHNAEAMFVDPVTGDLFILTKESTCRIYVAPKSQLDIDNSFELTFVRTIGFTVPSGADISPSGNEIIVRRENFAGLWLRLPGQTISDAFNGTATSIPVVGTPTEPNGEAIGFDDAGSGYFTLSDNAIMQPLYYFARTSSDGPKPLPEMLVAAGSNWKFLDNGSNQGTFWRNPGFNDGSWGNGVAQFGYGDGDEETVVSYGANANNKRVTTYFRKNFVANNVTDITNLTLKLVMDDGAAVFLNGAPVLYSNLPTNAAYNTLATATHVALQGTWQCFSADRRLLSEGTNTLAVEVHQSSVTGSNISFDFQLVANRSGQSIAYEPFSYVNGTELIGSTNAVGQWWSQAGPDSTNRLTNAVGNLGISGLAAPIGNCVTFGGLGTSARFNLNTTTSEGTWFYSFVLRVTDITGISPTGIFWAGFNTATGPQLTTPTTVGARLYTCAAPGGFNIGHSKASSTSTDWVWDSRVFKTNETAFVVGSYTFNSGTGDFAQLWINPSPETFGNTTAPPSSLTNTAGSDLSQLASFVLFNRSVAEPAGVLADELRIGTTWASVTPRSAVPPVLNARQIGNNVVLSWTINAAGFLPESSPVLETNSWAAVTSPVYFVGNQSVVTNTPTGTLTFYRLRKSP